MQNESKIAVVTASYSGLGSELCKMLARDGYELVLVNRDSIRADQQISQLRRMFPGFKSFAVTADLSDHESIRQAARQISENYERIRMLFHIAGMLQGNLAFSPQGNEMHYEVNTVGPYYLTQLLKPLLAADGHAVVTTVGSSAIRMIRTIPWNELRKPRKTKKFTPYALSKLVVAAAFVALAEQWAPDPIRIRIVDPGPNKTAMSKNSALPGLFKLLRVFYSAPSVGARRIYQAAHDGSFHKQTGIYIERGKAVNPPKLVRNKQVQADILALLGQTLPPVP